MAGPSACERICILNERRPEERLASKVKGLEDKEVTTKTGEGGAYAVKMKVYLCLLIWEKISAT